jgi:hypothetical protein
MEKHKDRMEALKEYAWPPPSEALIRSITADIENDPKLKITYKKILKKATSQFLAQLENEAGFQMDDLVRQFSAEYNHRVLKYGLLTMPSSFNIAEAFFKFDANLGIFKMKPLPGLKPRVSALWHNLVMEP